MLSKRYSFHSCVYCLVEKKTVLRRICVVLTKWLTLPRFVFRVLRNWAIVSENVFKLLRKTVIQYWRVINYSPYLSIVFALFYYYNTNSFVCIIDTFTFRAFSGRFNPKRFTISTFVIRSETIYRCRYSKDVHRTKCKY